MLDLWVVQCDRLFRVRTPDDARGRYSPEACEPPEREEHEPDEEQPRVRRRALLFH